MLSDEGCFLLERINMDFNFVTLRDSPLMISHWLTDNIYYSSIETGGNDIS